MDFYVVESSYCQYVNVKKLEELFCYWLCNDSVVHRNVYDAFLPSWHLAVYVHLTLR